MTQFLNSNTQLPQYMVFPSFLMEMEQLNETTKILYVLLLDRARLSLKNEGWMDEYGRKFIYFPIKTLAKRLHKSEMTIKNAMKVLEQNQLIVRKRQGPGVPNCIYVKILLESSRDMDKKLSETETENDTLKGKDIVCDKDNKVSSNKKGKSKNKIVKEEKKDILKSSKRNYECEEEDSL